MVLNFGLYKSQVMKSISILFFLIAIAITSSAQTGAVIFNSNTNQQQNFFYTPEQQKAPTYSQGWEQGYKEGWCYGKGYGCIDPIVPIPPIPRIGEDSFKGGYNRGFLQGLNDRDK